MINSEVQFVRSSWVLSGTFVIMLFRFFAETTFSSLHGNPVLYAGTDYSYQLFLSLGISSFLHNHYLPNLILDFLFFILLLGSWFSKNNRIYVFLLLVWMLVYIFHFNLLSAHHYHGLIGIPVLLFAILFKGKIGDDIWKICRYYVIFIFSSAAMWKLFRGSIFYEDQMHHILESQWVQFLSESSKSYISDLINNSTVFTWFLLLLGWLLQFSFIVGFFTRKFDSLLAAFILLFFVVNYFVMGIFSFELSILLIVFSPVEDFYRKKLYPFVKNWG